MGGGARECDPISCAGAPADIAKVVAHDRPRRSLRGVAAHHPPGQPHRRTRAPSRLRLAPAVPLTAAVRIGVGVTCPLLHLRVLGGFGLAPTRTPPTEAGRVVAALDALAVQTWQVAHRGATAAQRASLAAHAPAPVPAIVPVGAGQLRLALALGAAAHGAHAARASAAGVAGGVGGV